MLFFWCFFPSIVFDKNDNPLTSEEEEQRAVAKIKMLGNIKFIGELGKLHLIHESILHKCIKTVSFVNQQSVNLSVWKHPDSHIAPSRLYYMFISF